MQHNEDYHLHPEGHSSPNIVAAVTITGSGVDIDLYGGPDEILLASVYIFYNKDEEVILDAYDEHSGAKGPDCTMLIKDVPEAARNAGVD